MRAHVRCSLIVGACVPQRCVRVVVYAVADVPFTVRPSLQVIREELELAAAEAQTLRTEAQARAKAAESPAELALQQMRKEVNSLLEMKATSDEAKSSAAGNNNNNNNNNDNNENDDGAFEAQPEVQPRVAALAKEFAVLERLIRGWVPCSATHAVFVCGLGIHGKERVCFVVGVVTLLC